MTSTQQRREIYAVSSPSLGEVLIADDLTEARKVVLSEAIQWGGRALISIFRESRPGDVILSKEQASMLHAIVNEYVPCNPPSDDCDRCKALAIIQAAERSGKSN